MVNSNLPDYITYMLMDDDELTEALRIGLLAWQEDESVELPHRLKFLVQVRKLRYANADLEAAEKEVALINAEIQKLLVEEAQNKKA